ncbi:hypothetical protein [Gordonia humi]|uniref:Uncharacterized protein n=1 Tax=Gordonia humi TaxID=686429 RepID=A0A840F606_9ACTN|nr:hypothetical protein [Gordonia humi]MBB4138094.1 hypothetical protein [Gordonia humi]
MTAAIMYPTEVIDRLIAQYPELVEQAGGDPQFALWLVDVDRRLARRIGLGHRDMPDLAWRDAWESGTTAHDAALDAIDEWRADGDLF